MFALEMEAEVGEYFEEIYAWHCRAGPFTRRSGFRMMEAHALYFDFELPWWNEACANLRSRLAKTM